MIRFRPALVPTLITVPGLALAIGLGIWQLQRLEWKEALIAAVDSRVTAEAVPLDEALALPPAEGEWRRVFAEGAFLLGSEAYLFTIGPDGQPGYRVITPLQRAEGDVVLVDRGFVPEERRLPETRMEGQIPGPRRVEGILRYPQPLSLFTPEPDLPNRIWFARVPAAMAAELGVPIAADAVIEADLTPNPGGWPLGGQTMISFPNNHLHYAITWFGLALALLAVYLVYHRRQGRL